MNIFISADMEGVTGIVHGDQLMPSGKTYERGRKLMTADINAASHTGSTLDLKGTARLESNDGSYLDLSTSADLVASSGAKIGLTADALVEGGVVALQSKTGTVTADASGVTVAEGTIKITGTSVEIEGGGATGVFAGGLVKLN